MLWTPCSRVVPSRSNKRWVYVALNLWSMSLKTTRKTLTRENVIFVVDRSRFHYYYNYNYNHLDSHLPCDYRWLWHGSGTCPLLTRCVVDKYPMAVSWENNNGDTGYFWRYLLFRARVVVTLMVATTRVTMARTTNDSWYGCALVSA